MAEEALLAAAAEHGPWAILTFYLLWRDLQKDRATRDVLERNTTVLVEMTTMVRERLPRGQG